MTWILIRITLGAVVGLAVGFVTFEGVFALATLLGGYESTSSMLSEGAVLGSIVGALSGAFIGLRGIPWHRALIEGASVLSILYALYAISIVRHGASLARPAVWMWFLAKGLLVAGIAGGITGASAAWGVEFLSDTLRRRTRLMISDK